MNNSYGRETDLLHIAQHVAGKKDTPETDPIYLTTAFNVADLDELEAVMGEGGFTYNRSSNPNRTALAELISYMEGGEATLSCPSGMSAISTAVLALLESGDHIVADFALYGETKQLMAQILPKYNISVTHVDFSDLEGVKKAIQPNTKMIYCETISNPTMTVTDIPAVAKISKENGLVLMVDNTFATSTLIRPLECGADLVMNSLTKFAAGHSDALCGSLTGSEEIIQRCRPMQSILGTVADPFTSWLVLRSLRTMDLRVQVQMDNATKLAAALENNPHVKVTRHPSLPSHAQHELASKIFQNGYGAMLSFEMANHDRDKMNAFMQNLDFVKYAMTLGGYRTTIAHPVSSSHRRVPEEDRQKLGITFGLVRVSVGMEKAEDLIADFENALKVYDK